MTKINFFWQIVFLLIFLTASAEAAVFVYTDEASYLNDIATLGYTIQQESFENDEAWGNVRTTIVGGTQTANSIESLGIMWKSNNGTSEITTSNGPARTGNWGFYSLPHGNFLTGTDCHIPGNCGDGFGGTSSKKLYGVGGWVKTNTPFAEIDLAIDGNIIDFDENGTIGALYKFFGVIDTSGFTTFEFNELEGTLEDQKLIFSDDFTFAIAPLQVDIKANDSDVPLILAQGDNLNVTIALDPGSYLNDNSDWWIFIFYYDQGAGSLIPIVTTGFQAPLFNLPSTTLLNTTGFPAGIFLFFFGVDMVPNGVLDGSQLFSDIVPVIIQ